MMKRIKIIICFGHLLFGSISLNGQELTPNDEQLKFKIDNFLSNGVEHGFSGALLIANGGKLIINKGYGLADKKNNFLNTPNTVFDIGSNTKQFTATAILKLVEMKKLKVSDSLYKFFYDLPNDKRNITIHQLLTHSSGFVDSIGRDFDKTSEELFFQSLFETKLLHEPGSTYKYSNVGYSVLARIIELVSDQDYESFLTKYLFQPSNMYNTGYLIPNWDENMLAIGYSHNVFERGSMVNRYIQDGKVSWHLKGNGGINSTQEDMYNWYKALKSYKILSPDLFNQLITPYVKRYSGASAYGYGWGINLTERNTKRIAHNGANGSFFHTIIWSVKDDIVIIYASNTSYPSTEGLAHEIYKMISIEEYKPIPIRKGIYYMVLDYVKNHPVENAKQLISTLKKEYHIDYKNPNILNRIGYMILDSDKNLEWAVEIFKMNTQLFPFEGYVWDSLGDGYLANGQIELAVGSYKKAIELKCEETAEKLKVILLKTP